MSELRIVVNGAGAAGIRITEMLKAAGATSVVLCDSRGVVKTSRTDLNAKKREHAVDIAADTVGEAMRDSHVFVGVSVADCIKPEEVLSMASYPGIFAMSNPIPEIRPEIVTDIMGDQPYVMATGRSDYPNQVNNVLGFPFLFRGALDAGARAINLPMKVAAAEALAAGARAPVDTQVAELYAEEELEFGPAYVIPKPFDRRLFVDVSFAVAKAAVESGVAGEIDLDLYRSELLQRNDRRIGI